MKRISTIGLILVLAAFLTVAVIYAFANKAKENSKSQTENVTTSVADTVVQESGKHPHAEGSPECIEKHAKGECKGYNPGQPHHMEKGNNPGHGHAEGSAECKEKHTNGECTSHEPGQPHEETNHHRGGECQGHQPGEKHSENHSK